MDSFIAENGSLHRKHLMLLAKKLTIAGLLWAVLVVAGCKDNPGNWPKEKLAEHVKDSLIREGLEVSEVSLTEKEGGGFEGVGKVADGETLKLIVTQDPAAHRIEWDAKGDRGSFLDGSYELK
jgi:hypothetical protein